MTPKHVFLPLAILMFGEKKGFVEAAELWKVLGAMRRSRTLFTLGLAEEVANSRNDSSPVKNRH